MFEPFVDPPPGFDGVCLVTSLVFVLTGLAVLRRRTTVAGTLVLAGLMSIAFRSCRACHGPWELVRKLCYFDHATAVGAILVCGILLPEQRGLGILGTALMIVSHHPALTSRTGCGVHTLGHLCMILACASLFVGA